jgi:hypothetical protein
MARAHCSRSIVGAAGCVQGAYPDFQLEDKLFRQEGGNVMDSYFQRQYRRRKKGARRREP